MPTTPVVPYSQSSATKKDQVATMFNNISWRYDLLNRVLSFGIDIWWRKKAIAQMKSLQPKFILDVATFGTYLNRDKPEIIKKIEPNDLSLGS